MKASSPVQPQKASPVRAKPLLSPVAGGIATLVLVATVFGVYSPALGFQFILDDHHFVGDPRINQAGHLWEYFTTYVWSQVAGGPLSFYRPLFVLWMRVNYVLSESSPMGWHLLSIAKHVAVSLLLGILVWTLLRDWAASLLAATLFALHPAQAESVAWITVPDPLMSIAVIAAILFYLKYGDRKPANQRTVKSVRKSKQIRDKAKDGPAIWWIVLSATACLAALMAKESAIVLPAILFAAALITPQDSSERREFESRFLSAIRQMLPFVGVTLLYLVLRWNALKGHFSSVTQHLSWSTLLLSWPATLWFYVKVLLWPVRSRAFADPTVIDIFSLQNVVMPMLGVCGALALLAGIFFWAWKKSRRDLPAPESRRIETALVLGVLILVLPILLALNLNALNPGDFLHGRYTYLPLAGLMLLFATAWRLLSTKPQIALLALAGLTSIGFSVLTIKQESAWKDDLTVFTVASESAPHNQPVALSLSRARVQYAIGLDEEGRCDEAIPILQEAAQKYPDDWFAWAGMGECYYKLHDLPKAEQSMHRAADLAHNPRVTEQWQQLRATMGLQ